MARRRKSLARTQTPEVILREFDAVVSEEDSILKKRLDDLFLRIQNLERKMQVAQNSQEEEDEESKKRVREIGRLARLCCSEIASRGRNEENRREEEFNRLDQLLVSTAKWRVENYIDKSRSKGSPEDSYEFNVGVVPVLPETEDEQTVKSEIDNDDILDEKADVDGESDKDDHSSNNDDQNTNGSVRFDLLEELLTKRYNISDYSRIRLCKVKMYCRVVTTVTHIQWNYYVGAGLKDINEADCYQYEEISTKPLNGFEHKRWQMKDGDTGILVDGKLIPRSVIGYHYDGLLAQVIFVKASKDPDFNIEDKWFEVMFRTAERTEEEVDDINLMKTPEYIWGSIWMPGIYHGIWVAGLYDSLGYINIPDFIKDNKLSVGASVNLGQYGSSKTDVVTVDDYISVTNPVPSPGTVMPPTKADVASKAHTKVYDINGKLIFESDGLYDINGVLDKVPNTKSDIGEIVHYKDGASHSYKPGDF